MKPFDIELPFQNMYRQAIMNGNFDIWQRGLSFNTNVPKDYFSADRWLANHHSTATTFPIVYQGRCIFDNTGEMPGSKYFYRITTSGNVSSLGANDYFYLANTIENGVKQLCKSGNKLTLSFWARTTIANKKLGIYFGAFFGSGGSPSSNTYFGGTNIVLKSGWNKYTYTITVPSMTGKVFGTNNDDYLRVHFEYAYGSSEASYSNDTAANNLGSGTLDFAQVQLCEGEVDLPFMPKSFSQELQDCMRYYQKGINYEVAPGTIFDKIRYSMVCTGTTIIQDRIDFAVPMRYTPTIEYQSALEASAKWSVFNGTSWVTCAAAPTTQNASDKYFNINITCPFTPTKNYTYLCQGYWTADAEL